LGDNNLRRLFLPTNSWRKLSIRGNLGSKMGTIRKLANNKFLWAEIQEPIEFQYNESTIMIELTYLSLKKTTFLFVFSTYLPLFLLKFQSGELIGCRIWFYTQRVPTLHTFDRPRYSKNSKYLKKTSWWCHHHICLGISCFWGSKVHQKYAVWILVGCRIKFRIQWALSLRIWVKTQGYMSKIRTQKVVFFIPPPKLITIILLF